MGATKLYPLSPRLKSIGKTRFWRTNKKARYGALNQVVCHQINLDRIVTNWDDLLRVAGSLKLGQLSASEFMKTLQASKGTSDLAKAIAEVGRIAKTIYLLTYIDDATYRQRILLQLNRGEQRHQLARAVFHGRKGELRQRYQQGQEDQLGALGLVVNMIGNRSEGAAKKPGFYDFKSKLKPKFRSMAVIASFRDRKTRFLKGG